jgi:hypothetical protein
MEPVKHLKKVLAALNRSYLRIPLEQHRSLYQAICAETAGFVEADVVTLFLRESTSVLVPARQSLRMVAANPGSPWHRAGNHREITYAQDSRGTTTSIWKTGEPQTCNNLATISEMRGSQAFPGKPGQYDESVWTGRNLWGCSRDFVALPLRISGVS